MQSFELLPGPIKDVHTSLEPFIKQGQEALRIKRVLALHLSSHVSPEGGLPLSQPLSLVECGSSVGSVSSGIRGIRREYLRCIRANSKAREEYQKARRDHRTAEGHDDPPSKDNASLTNSLALFLDVVEYRRNHEKLQILQDYLDMLAQKPAAAAGHLDPQVILKSTDSPPSVPSDVMGRVGPRQEFQRTDLNELVDQLEKSVMRAKLLLKREQKLLANIRAESQSHGHQSGSKLQALGVARNELISWIETELAVAGDGGTDAENQQNSSLKETNGKDYINSKLSYIQRQYARYTKARQALVIAATVSLDVIDRSLAEDYPSVLEAKDEVELPTSMSHVLQPYLKDLTSVSSQQKSMIQQKSYLTISLAKQLKEASQGLDRLADESHLLPGYPLESLQPKASQSSSSFSEGIASHEKPDSSHRARAWVHASMAASKATNEDVVEKLEEGELAILEARQTLLDLQSLLGEEDGSGTESKVVSKDLWATFDGNLGAITREGVE